MLFEQIHISPTLETFFGANFRMKWNLTPYSDPNKPSVFLGLYREDDIQKFLSHRSYRIFILGGSDMKQKTLSILQNTINDGRTFTWMYPGKLSNILTEHNIVHKKLYIALKDYSAFKPTVLGNKIYVYKGARKEIPGYYKWKEVVEPIISYFGKDRVLYTSNKTINFLIDNVYSQSFVYIKPNEKGGNTTMWELGHMGRKTIGKGHVNMLNYIEYSDVNHLIRLIKNEEKFIGKVRYDVAEDLQKQFEDSRWLSLDYWKK